MIWSMLANVGGYVAISLAWAPGAEEHRQASLFVDVLKRPGEAAGASFWRGTASAPELYPEGWVPVLSFTGMPLWCADTAAADAAGRVPIQIADEAMGGGPFAHPARFPSLAALVAALVERIDAGAVVPSRSYPGLPELAWNRVKENSLVSVADQDVLADDELLAVESSTADKECAGASAARKTGCFDVEEDELHAGGAQFAEHGKQRACLRRGDRRGRGFLFAHEPVFATRPPKRRSRLAYSAIAPSSAALSKSGQCIGTNTSSL